MIGPSGSLFAPVVAADRGCARCGGGASGPRCGGGCPDVWVVFPAAGPNGVALVPVTLVFPALKTKPLTSTGAGPCPRGCGLARRDWGWGGENSRRCPSAVGVPTVFLFLCGFLVRGVRAPVLPGCDPSGAECSDPCSADEGVLARRFWPCCNGVLSCELKPLRGVLRGGAEGGL